MTDPTLELLRAANPVRDCPAPSFDRLLARLEHEPVDALETVGPPMRGRFPAATVRKAPRIGGGRRMLALLAPVAVAVVVAAAALVSLHGNRPVHRGAPSGSLAFAPGQARGRVVPGSMRRFSIAAAGARGQTWGAEWFQTTRDQICVQAGREVGNRLGYVDTDGIIPRDGRFHAWAPDTAVDARCIDRPAHGGIALTVVQRVADNGIPLSAGGACSGAGHSPCPPTETTTLSFGVLGSGAAMLSYGSERHSIQTLAPGPGPDGVYIQALPTASNACSVSVAGCHARFPLPRPRAVVLYTGTGRVCVLRGPGVDGVLSGVCRYGLTLGPSPLRLTAAEVRTPVTATTTRHGHTISVAARFRTRLPSTRLSEYQLHLSTPERCPPSAATTSASLPLGPGFRARAMLTIHGTVSAPCSGTYRGAVIVQPLVGSPLTVGRFSFTARPRP